MRGELHALQTALEHLGAYVYMKDAESRYTYANPATCRLFGRPLEEIVGQPDEAFFDPEMSVRLRANDRLVLDEGRTVSSEETGVVEGFEGVRVFWAVKTPIPDEHGNIIGVCGVSTDITDRKRLEQRLDDQLGILDTVLDNVDAYIYMKSRSREYLYVNRQWADLFHTTPDQVVGRMEPDLLPPDVAARFWKFDQRVFETQTRLAEEEAAVTADGETRYFWSVKVPLGHLGRPDELIGFSTDVTELRHLREELEELAYTDSLTGVRTRGFFIEQAAHQVHQAQRYGRPLTLAIMDLDHFKLVNDSFGHAAGDVVLASVAQACRSVIRDADMFGRIGGEEFAFLLPDTDLASARTVAERLASVVRDLAIPVGGGHAPVRPTASIGIAQCSSSQTGEAAVDALFADADAALYAAKAAGRDCVRAFDGDSTPSPST